MWPFSRHLSETNLTQTDKEMCLTEELQSAEHDAAARPAGGRGHGTWKRRPSETGSTCTRDARPLVTVRWCFLEKRALKQQLLTDRPHCRFNGGDSGKEGSGGDTSQPLPPALARSLQCPGRRADREERVGGGPWAHAGLLFPPRPACSGPVPSVSHDNHAQLVPEVLHLVDLHKRPRVVDLVQALDHVGLVAEGEGCKGTSAQVPTPTGRPRLRGRKGDKKRPFRPRLNTERRPCSHRASGAQ